MSFHFKDLDDYTRKLMLEEIDYDIDRGKLYLSKYFTAEGNEKYATILKKTIEGGGTEVSLANTLRNQGCFKIYDEKHPKKDGSPSKVPITAHTTFSEGEFNRLYIRALCKKATAEGLQVEVYRAKKVQDPRPESQRLIGQLLDPKRLLDDLRQNIAVDTILGVPPGPNSGLSVRIKK